VSGARQLGAQLERPARLQPPALAVDRHLQRLAVLEQIPLDVVRQFDA
jgi:hypothetical protein